MTINSNNFEEYLVDYIDGNLDPLLTAELMAFLAENPEYENYLPGKEFSSLLPSAERYTYKNFLRKDFKDISEINDNNFDEFCIAASEGLLDQGDLKRLNEFIGNDSLKINNLELISSLRLYQDNSIQYPDKDKLRRNNRGLFRMKYLYYGLAVAASVAVIFLLTLNRSGSRPSEMSSRITRNNPVFESQPNTSETVAPQLGNNSSSSSKSLVKRHSAKEINPSALYDKGITPNSAAEPSFLSEDIAISFLQPVLRRIPVAENRPELILPGTKQDLEANPKQQKRRFMVVSDNLFTEIFSRVNFWKTAETAISGFNYLTEAQLSIDKTMDEKGKLTGVSLNTESYTISGKVK